MDNLSRDRSDIKGEILEPDSSLGDLIIVESYQDGDVSVVRVTYDEGPPRGTRNDWEVLVECPGDFDCEVEAAKEALANIRPLIAERIDR